MRSRSDTIWRFHVPWLNGSSLNTYSIKELFDGQLWENAEATCTMSAGSLEAALNLNLNLNLNLKKYSYDTSYYFIYLLVLKLSLFVYGLSSFA
jgi:hypothetical protein